MTNADNNRRIRIVIVALAALGTLGLLAVPVSLAALAVSGGENPTWLPLENYGITEYKVLDSDVSGHGLRSADLTVSQGNASSLGEYRSIALSIKEDREYQDRDYISILFIKRLSDASPEVYAVVARTERGLEKLRETPSDSLSGSKDGDGVYLYEFPK
ncbi:MAG: hypothetical protein H0U04_03355 [Rubrobacter sp.]|nr:hypothetical protein [Rubrobacter sp.]